MSVSIKDKAGLNAEIVRLEAIEEQQKMLLKERFQSPSAAFSTLLTLSSKSPTADGIRNHKMYQQDFVGLASRFVLPFVLNRTLFRRSNFIVKAFVAILSQKAARYINEDKVLNLYHVLRSKVMTVLHKQDHKTALPRRAVL